MKNKTDHADKKKREREKKQTSGWGKKIIKQTETILKTGLRLKRQQRQLCYLNVKSGQLFLE